MGERGAHFARCMRIDTSYIKSGLATPYRVVPSLQESAPGRCLYLARSLS
jgi:hypothetical protein